MFAKTPEFISAVNDAASRMYFNLGKAYAEYVAGQVSTAELENFSRKAESIVTEVMVAKRATARKHSEALIAEGKTRVGVLRDYGFLTEHLLTSSGIDSNSDTLVRCTVQKPGEEVQFMLSWQPANEDDIAVLEISPFRYIAPDESSALDKPSVLAVKAFTSRDLAAGKQEESTGDNILSLHKDINACTRFQTLRIAEELVDFLRAEPRTNLQGNLSEAASMDL